MVLLLTKNKKYIPSAPLLFMLGTALLMLFHVLFSLSFMISLIPRVLWGFCEEPFLNQIRIQAVSEFHLILRQESPGLKTHQNVGKFLSKCASVKIGTAIMWRINSGWLIKGNNESHTDLILRRVFWRRELHYTVRGQKSPKVRGLAYIMIQMWK